MRNLTRVSIVVAGSAALVGSMALPASAVDDLEESNTATVVVEAGFLTVSTPDDGELVLEHLEASTVETEATGKFTGVTVKDLNSDGLGWSSTVELTSLYRLDNSGEPTAVDLATTASYEATNFTNVSGGVTPDVTGGTVTVPTAAGLGNTSATWDTDVSITIPSNALAGTYEGALEYSVS